MNDLMNPQNVTIAVSTSLLQFSMTGLFCREVGTEGRLLEPRDSSFEFSPFNGVANRTEFKQQNLQSSLHAIMNSWDAQRAEQKGFWCSEDPSSLLLGSGVNNQLHHKAYFRGRK